MSNDKEVQEDSDDDEYTDDSDSENNGSDSDSEEQAWRLQELEYKIGHRPSTEELIEKNILYKKITDMKLLFYGYLRSIHGDLVIIPPLIVCICLDYSPRFNGVFWKLSNNEINERACYIYWSNWILIGDSRVIACFGDSKTICFKIYNIKKDEWSEDILYKTTQNVKRCALSLDQTTQQLYVLNNYGREMIVIHLDEFKYFKAKIEETDVKRYIFERPYDEIGFGNDDSSTVQIITLNNTLHTISGWNQRNHLIWNHKKKVFEKQQTIFNGYGYYLDYGLVHIQSNDTLLLMGGNTYYPNYYDDYTESHDFIHLYELKTNKWKPLDLKMNECSSNVYIKTADERYIVFFGYDNIHLLNLKKLVFIKCNLKPPKVTYVGAVIDSFEDIYLFGSRGSCFKINLSKIVQSIDV